MILSEEEIAKFREKNNTINELFIAYYKTLLNFSEEEFSEFLKISLKDLSLIIWINKIYSFRESLEELKLNYLLKKVSIFQIE